MLQLESLCPAMKDATWGNEDLLCHNQDSMKPNKYINNFFKKVYTCWVVFSGSSDGRVHLQCRGPKFHPWVKKMPWRRGWLPTLVFLPGRFHGQRSLAGYSPWGCKESDTTELLTHTHTHTHTCARAHTQMLSGHDMRCPVIFSICSSDLPTALLYVPRV